MKAAIERLQTFLERDPDLRLIEMSVHQTANRMSMSDGTLVSGMRESTITLIVVFSPHDVTALDELREAVDVGDE